jgi:hypothetical protein
MLHPLQRLTCAIRLAETSLRSGPSPTDSDSDERVTDPFDSRVPSRPQ